MRFYLLFLVVLCAGMASAQTRAIAHKSHSGSAADLALVHEAASADFGLSEEMEQEMKRRLVEVRRVARVVRLSDSTALAVRHSYRKDASGNAVGSPINTRRDTLHFEPAATQPDCLKQAKATTEAWYGAEAKETRYIGFEKKADPKPVRKKAAPATKVESRPEASSVLPMVPAGGGNDDTPGNGPLILVFTAALAAALTGAITWLYRRTPLAA
ncbi:hypothetical protein [Flaviaesturariibacter amylovorans]|uniref:Secreted protein n=1 Tax=Flaviaesturariibacter amylovorans TaxID=1084520 RepID=A0ABP8H9H7_9BACT